jgi:hypothetical protein
MSLWGNIDYSSGNNKPKYANTSNVQSNSTINGVVANTAKFYGPVFGVSATEASNTLTDGPYVVHPGWVSQKVGTGPIIGVALVGGGSGYNSGGYLTVTDTSIYGKGTAANISFTIANTRNTMQGYSTNANWNVVNSIVVNAGGSLYSDSDQITLSFPATPISAASYTVTLGGRGDRRTYETLVAMRSITGDDPRDNATFTGI